MSKTNKKTHHPYAKLFEYVFQKNEMVEEFVENFFPASLLEKLDISSLKAQSISYLSPELSRLYSDVVYTCDYGSHKDKVLITLLFEHKSYYAQNPHLQLLGYMLKIWEQQRDNSDLVTPIIPVILYHGEEKWKERKFTDMFSGNLDDDLERFIPNFDLHLIDLNKESDEKLKQLNKRFLTSSLLTFKYHKNQAYIRQHFSFLVEVDNDIYQETILVFLIKNYDISKPEVAKLLSDTSEKSKSKIMNAIEAYYAEGMQKGMQKGMQQGMQQGEEKGLHNKNVQAIKRMVEKELPVSLMVEILNVEEEFIKGVVAGTVTEMP